VHKVGNKIECNNMHGEKIKIFRIVNSWLQVNLCHSDGAEDKLLLNNAFIY